MNPNQYFIDEAEVAFACQPQKKLELLLSYLTSKVGQRAGRLVENSALQSGKNSMAGVLSARKASVMSLA